MKMVLCSHNKLESMICFVSEARLTSLHLFYFTAMLRRSSRLQSNGYYGCDGKPVISYKETMYRFFKRCKSHLRPRFDGSPDTELDKPDQTGPANWPWRTMAFVLFLCFGVFLTLAVPTGFSITTVKKVFTGSSEDVWIHLKEVRGELEELKELRGELKELKELRGQMKKLKELQEELKEKMVLLHPLSDTMANFALERLGARILTEKTSESYPPEVPGLTLFGFTVVSAKRPPPVSPRTLLQGWAPNSPGQCWAFKGSKGQLSVELSHSIYVSHVSIGHIPKNISPYGTRSSALRMFSVFGNQNIEDPKIYLGTFEYDASGRPLQLFKMAGHERDVVKYLTLKIHSNWGNHNYTCIYSFRVHGKKALSDL
ncbi:SUN domain-containing protein 5-like isoform X2 [Archocentrus centrarchus]|uniref:SUN domain-containing protein 5-like isoform X2 n=1 Tax=Archocentrus centrarchus TaxID=63155 RepID=UPI0011E9F5FE|nr:SUN domain-containing protein 5-like isoform X2 [Archocentrus centrarchus]